MSTEKLSFTFNSLIPETYKSKAEAFARSLQQKLLSLGRPNNSSDSFPKEPDRRLSDDNHEEKNSQETKRKLSPKIEKNQENFNKTDFSDDKIYFEGAAEKGKKQEGISVVATDRNLITMSSEDSTTESWGSCQESLTDFDKFDSETEEEVNSFASQIKGSPKLRGLGVKKKKKKELRDKPWKKNSRKNYSPPEKVDIEMKGLETSDSETNAQFILLYGLENEEVPHRILRESLPTSILGKHFSESSEKYHKTTKETSIETMENQRPSPEVTQKETTEDYCRLSFAEEGTEGIELLEVEGLDDFCTQEISQSVKKINGIIVECTCDTQKKELKKFVENEEDLIITVAEVFQPAEIQAGDEEMLGGRATFRRCSSLKTWKTPPGTPGAKKIVRFADALGLDLADVRTFLDEIPKIPNSAFDDLHGSFSPEFPPITPPTPTLIPLFQQPSTKLDFLDKVQLQKICLESAMVTDTDVLTVTGYVRVWNVSFHKSVHVRYSLNKWNTFSDLQAIYVPNSCDGFSDKFSFTLFGHTLKIGEQLEFALRFDSCGTQYWDNNGGVNYVFNCVPLSTTTNNKFFIPPYINQVEPWFDLG